MKVQMRLWNLLIAGVLLCSALFGGIPSSHVQADANPPIALSTTSAHTENFDSIGSALIATLPTAWGVTKEANVRTVSPFSSAVFATERQGGNGMTSGSTNGIYNFGAGDPAAATDRAIGFLASSSATKSGNLFAHLSNSTGTALSALTISYNVEKYRNGTNGTSGPSGFAIQLYYSFNGTEWLTAGSDFYNLFLPDADTNGFANAPGATQSVTNKNLPVTIPNGSDFYLGWNYSVATGTYTSYAQGLGVDDISFLGVPATGPTNPSGTGAANPNKVVDNDTETLLTVSVVPGTNPASTALAVSCDLSTIGGSATQAFFDDTSHGDITAGDNIFSFSTTVDSSTPAGMKNLPCSISDDQSRTASATIEVTLNTITILPIGTVNGAVLVTNDGAAHASPYAGQTVIVQGVVYEKTLQAISNSTNTYKGFFIQNTATSADGLWDTSDGMFIFMNTNTTMSGPSGAYLPKVGDDVIISGLVTEYKGMTEMTNPVLLALKRRGVNIDTEIPPFIANPPESAEDANRYWEFQQGMRAEVPADSLVVSGRNVFSPADGEIWLVNPDNIVAKRTTAYTNRVFRDAHPLDDNYDEANWDGNGYRMLMGSLGIKASVGDASTLIEAGRTFDTVSSPLTGGINYTYSKYRIEVTAQPVYTQGVDPAANNPPPAILDRTTAYSIADYNLENLYDYRDNPASACDFTGNLGCAKVDPFLSAVTPPYDYVPASDADYQARLTDIALQIKNDLHSPDILMVQEVENQDICTVTGATLTCGTTNNADGKPDVLQELALKVAANGGPTYEAAWDRDSSDLRGIAPAYMYRTDRVQLLSPDDDPVLGANPAITYAGAPVAYNSDISNPKTLNAVLPAGVTACETSWVFPRAPDVALFRIYQTGIEPDSYQETGSYQDVYTINNHFKSSPDSCVTHRTEQARYNAALVVFIQASNPEARVVVGGDLNVYPRPDDPFLANPPEGKPGTSDQLGSLYDSALGMTNMFDVMVNQTPELAYSYVYLGMAQTLDQVFLNQTMLTNLTQVQVAHINSDFPSDNVGDGARGTSDHDPLVAVFSFTSQLPPTADAGGPYKVDQIKDIQLTATGTDPTDGTLIYAWDLDNNGTFETKGANIPYHAGIVPGNHTVKVKVTGRTGLTKVLQVNVFVNFRYIFPIIGN